MKKTKIIIVRHGQVRNPKNIVYGRLPGFPLSKTGKEEIRKAALKLEKHRIDTIYTSPIERAVETARIIGNIVGKKPIVLPLLTEVDAKAVQGMNAVFFHKYVEPEYYTKKWYKKGIEHVTSIQNRMAKAIDEISKKHSGETVVVVSHGDPIVMLKAYCEGKDFTYDYKMKHYVGKGKYIILEIDNNGKKIVTE